MPFVGSATILVILALVSGCGSGGGTTSLPISCLTPPSFSASSLGRFQGLNRPMGVALLPVCNDVRVLVLEEAGGLSLARMDTGEVLSVFEGFVSPFAMVLEPDSDPPSLLVTEATQVTRLNVNTRGTSSVATMNRPTGLAIDPADPDSVLVVEGSTANLYRMSRAGGPGSKTLVLNHSDLARARGIAFEQPGVLLVSVDNAVSGRVVRVDLRQNPPTVTGLTAERFELRLPFGLFVLGDLAYVTAQSANQLVRLAGLASSGAVTLTTHIDNLKGPTGLARLADGRLVIAQHATNDLVLFDPTCAAPPCQAPAPVVAGLGTPGDLLLEDSRTALVVERNALDTSPNAGALSRVDVNTGTVTLVTSGLNVPEGIALIGRTAYVAERGSTGSGTASGRIKAINLDNGVATLVTSAPLSAPSGLAVLDPDTLLATERSAGKISLVTVTGAVSSLTLQNPIPAPLGIALMLGGDHALVTDASVGSLFKVNVKGCNPCTVETIANTLVNPGGIAVEPSGASALVITDAGGASGGAIVRVFLQGAAVPAGSTIVSGLSHPQRIVIESSGGTALVTETDPDGVRRVSLPPP
jgi:glucose/arabinose dehydrogenase